MYTFEKRKPLEFLTGPDTWVRNKDGEVVGIFIETDAREPWRSLPTFRPFIKQQRLAHEVCAELGAQLGLPT